MEELLDQYGEDLEPDTDEEAKQAIKMASNQMRELVIAKSKREEQMREDAALQRRQGTMSLQTWNGETTGWRTFLRTAEILKKTYNCKVEQATKLKSILSLPEHKLYVDSFRSTEDPIGEFIRLLTPRYSSPQFLMAELEANIAKLPDVEVNMSSKDLMSNITKVKLQLMLFSQNNLSLTVSAAEKIASKFRLEEQRKLRRLFVEAAYDPTKMMDTITALADMVYQAEAAQAIFET